MRSFLTLVLTMSVLLGSSEAQAETEVLPAGVGGEKVVYSIANRTAFTILLEFSIGTSSHEADSTPAAIRIEPGQVLGGAISCSIGAEVCYGAWAVHRASIEWGKGKAMTHTCSRCCVKCSDGVISKNLVYRH